MLKSIEIEINPTPREVAECIFDMDAEEQAELLKILALRKKYDCIRYYKQLQNIRAEIIKNFSSSDKARIIAFADNFYEFFCEEMESGQQ